MTSAADEATTKALPCEFEGSSSEASLVNELQLPLPS
jgi:hypothetical protein